MPTFHGDKKSEQSQRALQSDYGWHHGCLTKLQRAKVIFEKNRNIIKLKSACEEAQLYIEANSGKYNTKAKLWKRQLLVYQNLLLSVFIKQLDSLNRSYKETEEKSTLDKYSIIYKKAIGFLDKITKNFTENYKVSFGKTSSYKKILSDLKVLAAILQSHKDNIDKAKVNLNSLSEPVIEKVSPASVSPSVSVAQTIPSASVEAITHERPLSNSLYSSAHNIGSRLEEMKSINSVCRENQTKKEVPPKKDDIQLNPLQINESTPVSGINSLQYDYSLITSYVDLEGDDKTHFEKALHYFNKQNYTEAIVCFQHIENIFSSYNRGICYLMLAKQNPEFSEGYTAIAMDDFEETMNIFGNASYNLGVYHLKKSFSPTANNSTTLPYFKNAANLGHIPSKNLLSLLEMDSKSSTESKLDTIASSNSLSLGSNSGVIAISWGGWLIQTPFMFRNQQELKSWLVNKEAPDDPSSLKLELAQVLHDYAIFRSQKSYRYHYLFIWQPNRSEKLAAVRAILTFLVGNEKGEDQGNSQLLTPAVMKSATDGDLQRILIKYGMLDNLMAKSVNNTIAREVVQPS